MLDPKLKTLSFRGLTQTMRRSPIIHLIPWQFWMIGLAPFKSSLWSSRPPNVTKFFANGKETSPLQPYFHEIERSHLNSFMEVSNILSLISHHCIFRFQTNRVGTFKRMNIELQTSKWSNDRSKRKVCIFSNKFRWSLMTFTLEFLRRNLKNGQLNQS